MRKSPGTHIQFGEAEDKVGAHLSLIENVSDWKGSKKTLNCLFSKRPSPKRRLDVVRLARW